ncbi:MULTISPECIES: pyridoxal-phosphate dependent enzyme [Saccharothrix]|uniref:pyridoxal-phosphate dependent enzyme n=1 Tax=Saccharothrix TaxID=2071 RepID=UPI00093C1B65|nr:pyridoxal-phosphate dependent enzyme [Saccharothrix sp. CB00851]OKI22093.1 cysteine synthase [Saccharothrix sp. CB00851]
MGAWAARAIRRVREDHRPTPLRRLSVGTAEVFLKDETALPTGSTKDRTVAAMFRHAIASGRITEGTGVVVATAGAVAVAAARIAALLDLPFTALVPAKADPAVLARIDEAGGRWQRAEQPPAALQHEARALAERWGACFLDHFAEAEPAVAAWPPTIADELFAQLPEPPRWVVVGAGTGATSAAIGRHIRTEGLDTKLAVVDPENSAYFPAWASGARDYGTGMPSRIPGIGRPRVEPGFQPGVVDLVIPVPDAASVAALRWLHHHGVDAGPSTGTALWGVHHLTAVMRERGPLVTIIADGGDPYRETYLDPAWPRANGLDPGPHEDALGP